MGSHLGRDLEGWKLILLNRKDMPLAGIADIRPPQANDHITQAIVDDVLQAIHDTGMLDSPAISSSEESVHLGAVADQEDSDDYINRDEPRSDEESILPSSLRKNTPRTTTKSLRIPWQQSEP